MAGSTKYYDLPPNSTESRGFPTYSAPITDSGPSTYNPNIDAACQECEQYQLKVNVVTRLGGIPVKGIKYEVWKNYEYQSLIQILLIARQKI